LGVRRKKARSLPSYDTRKTRGRKNKRDARLHLFVHRTKQHLLLITRKRHREPGKSKGLAKKKRRSRALRQKKGGKRKRFRKKMSNATEFAPPDRKQLRVANKTRKGVGMVSKMEGAAKGTHSQSGVLPVNLELGRCGSRAENSEVCTTRGRGVKREKEIRDSS